MNKYVAHVYVILEDDADRQIAVGFVGHHHVKHPRIQVMPVAGGWTHVLSTIRDEYIQKLRSNFKAHVVMLIDFDGAVEDRRKAFETEISLEIQPRVFVVGSKHTPESLRSAFNKSFERIGESLADDCVAGTSAFWEHEQLIHNNVERERLIQAVGPFLLDRSN
jgi:hypothetical protein